MEMINQTARDRMTAAGMESAHADAVASYLPAWSQFATKQDLREIEVRFIHLEHKVGNLRWWIVGAVIASVALPDNVLGFVLRHIPALQG